MSSHGLQYPLVFSCESCAPCNGCASFDRLLLGILAIAILRKTMARQVCAAFPAFERFFKFVDYDGYELGRLGQEQRKIEKQQTLLI